MFLHLFVCSLGEVDPAPSGWRYPQEEQGTRQEVTPVLKSSGGHCSGRYSSYWNALLLYSSCDSADLSMPRHKHKTYTSFLVGAGTSSTFGSGRTLVLGTACTTSLAGIFGTALGPSVKSVDSFFGGVCNKVKVL